MKKIFFILSLLLIMACEGAHKGYFIEGKVTKEEAPIKKGVVYLRELSNRSVPVDSAIIKNGRFRMSGEIKFPDKYLLYIEGVPHSIPIFLENERYKVSASAESLRESVVTGGETQTLINIADRENKKIIDKYRLNDVIPLLIDRTTSKEVRDSAIQVMDLANERMRSVVDSLTNISPLSYYSLNVLAETSKRADLDIVKDRFKVFQNSDLFNDHPYLNRISEVIQIREQLKPGMIAPDFILPEMGGREYSLAELYSKSSKTMLLFWNSMSTESIDYCNQLKPYYERYSTEGFNIITIAVGDIEISWKSVTADHSFNWIQLFDNTRDILTNRYNITTIPYNLLIDSSGIILEHNVSVERLSYYF